MIKRREHTQVFTNKHLALYIFFVVEIFTLQYTWYNTRVLLDIGYILFITRKIYNGRCLRFFCTFYQFFFSEHLIFRDP